MFYSQNILTRKGKLGIIWLAATYHGPRSKYLNTRDFKKVNIIKACEYIMHPSLPFALRLSSTLLVGVVRVYREQARIILYETNEVMKAVRAAIAEKRLTSELQMKVPEQRRDAITLPLLLDIDMDFPECQEQMYTDHLVAFAKSDKFFQVPFVVSPKLPLPSPYTSPELQKVSTEEERSPFQADRKDITIPEIDYTRILESELIEVPGEIDIVEPFSLEQTDDLMRKLGEVTPEKQLGPSPLRMAEGGTVLPVEEADVLLFDEQTGILRPEAMPAKRLASEIADQFTTPQASPEGLEPVDMRPTRKRRRLAIDFAIKLTGNAMKRNFNNMDSFKRKKIYDLPRRPTAAELFSTPSTPVVSQPPFMKFWKVNAIVRPLQSDQVQWIVDVPTGLLGSPIPSSQEEFSGLDDSPSSGIEILRAASREITSEFEQSAGMDVTPDLTYLDKSHRSRDLSLSGEKKLDIGTPVRRGTRQSVTGRTSFLSPIIDEDLEIEMLPLEEIEEQFTLDEEKRDEVKSDEGTLVTLSNIKRSMGDKPGVWFNDFLSLDTPRKQTARVFYRLMALTSSGVVHLSQNAPYEEIYVRRGRGF